MYKFLILSIIFTHFFLVNSIFCPNPLNSGQFIGGTCDLIPNTLLSSSSSNSVFLDLKFTTINCNGNSGLEFSNNNVTIINGAFVNCLRISNLSLDGGGALKYIGNGIITLRNIICTNSSVKYYVNNSYMNDMNGGCLYSSNANLTIIEDSSFNNCVANNGGAIYSNNIISINNSYFNNCSSINNGGAIHSNDDLYLINSNFNNCSSLNNGGAIYSNNDLYVEKSNFLSCSAIGNGGAVYSIYSINNTTLIDSFFNNCTAYIGGAIYLDSNPENLIKNCIFHSCYSNFYGGAIYGGQTKLNIEDSNFLNCFAFTSGGAIYSYVSPLHVNNSNFINCRCSSSGTSGGALYSTHNTDISDSKFINCSAVSGNVLYGFGSYLNYTIQRSIFDSNKNTGGTGSVLYMYDYFVTGSLTISDCDFTNNRANIGGVIVYTGITNVKCTNFINNTVTNVGSVFYGGANPIFTNVTLINNVGGNTFNVINNGNVSIRDYYCSGSCVFTRTNATSSLSSIPECVQNRTIGGDLNVPNISSILEELSFTSSMQMSNVESSSLIQSSSIGTSTSNSNVNNSVISSSSSSNISSISSTSSNTVNNISSSNNSNTVNTISSSVNIVNNDTSISSSTFSISSSISSSTTPTSIQQISPVISTPVYNLNGDIYSPITTDLDIYFNDQTVLHISTNNEEPMISTTGDIYGSGTLIIDLSDFDYSTDEIILFNSYPITAFDHIEVIGANSCYNVDITSLTSLKVEFSCTSDSSNILNLF